MAFAIIFDSVGAGEWLVLLAVLLIVMGPRRLPSAARQLGGYVARIRRAADGFKRQLLEMDLELEREAKAAGDALATAVSDLPNPAPETGDGHPTHPRS